MVAQVGEFSSCAPTQESGEYPVVRWTAAIVEASSALSKDLHVAEAVTAILELTEKWFNASIAYLHDIAGGELRLAGHFGVTPELSSILGALTLATPCIPARVATTRHAEAFRAGYGEANELTDGRAIFSESDARWILAAPLAAGDELFGVLCYSLSGPRDPAPAELDLLSALASVFALGLSKANALAEKRRLKAQVEALYTADVRFVSPDRREREVVPESKRGKHAQAISEEHLHRILDDAPIGMALVSLGGDILRANNALCEIVGYDPEELLTMPFEDLLHPDDPPDSLQTTRLLRGEIARGKLQKRLLHKNGSVVYVMLSSSVLHDRAGEPLHVIAQVEDVTERKKIEQALLDSSHQFRALFEGSLEGIMIADNAGRLTDVNPTTCAMLRAPREALIGRSITEISSTGAPHTTSDLLRMLLETGGQQGEARLHTADGRVIDVEYTARAHFLPGRHVAIFRDVTARRRAEAALRQSEDSLARAQQIAHIGNWDWDMQRGQLLWSAECHRIFGLKRRHLGGSYEAFLEMVHPADRESVRSTVDSALHEGKPYDIIHRIVRQDGEERFVHGRGELIRDDNGRAIRMVGTVQDVTDHRRAEEARQRAEEERERLAASIAADRSWLKTVIERSPVGILLTEYPARRLTANRRAEELFGRAFSPECDLEEFAWQICTPDGRALPEGELPSPRVMALGEDLPPRELLIRQPDGRLIPVLANAGPILDEQGCILGSAVVLEDITLLKDLERLREEWTSIVAHDLRQPIATIAACAGMLAQSARFGRGPAGTGRPESERERVWADHILTSVKRLDRMIADLLDVSRLEARHLELQLELTDLPTLLNAVAERIVGSLRNNPVQLTINGDIPSVSVDPARIEQIVDNLLSNAAKYGLPGATIRVIVEPRDGEVEVAVQNAGRGITPEDLPKLFQRFSRGRAKSGPITGLGLGLYITKGLVEAHRGRIWAESTLGESTTFRFTLPVD